MKRIKSEDFIGHTFGELTIQFDNEFLEAQTDEILRLIRQQGGEV